MNKVRKKLKSIQILTLSFLQANKSIHVATIAMINAGVKSLYLSDITSTSQPPKNAVAP